MNEAERLRVAEEKIEELQAGLLVAISLLSIVSNEPPLLPGFRERIAAFTERLSETAALHRMTDRQEAVALATLKLLASPPPATPTGGVEAAARAQDLLDRMRNGNPSGG